jgi:hypothetical protein
VQDVREWDVSTATRLTFRDFEFLGNHPCRHFRLRKHRPRTVSATEQEEKDLQALLSRRINLTRPFFYSHRASQSASQLFIMVLIYAVVCRATDAVVLSEACDKDLKGSIGPAFLELLQHLRDERPLAEGDRQTFVQKEESTTINNAVDDFMSYFLRSCQAAIGETKDWEEAQDGEGDGGVNDDYYFHIFRRNDVYYGCLGDDARLAYQKVNFAFLEQVANEFSKRYWTSRVKNAKAHGMDDTFLPTLRSAMHYHNIHADTLQQDAKVKHLLAKTESMQNLMGRNLKCVRHRCSVATIIWRPGTWMVRNIKSHSHPQLFSASTACYYKIKKSTMISWPRVKH